MFIKGHKINLGKRYSLSRRRKISKNHANFDGSNNPNWKGGRIIRNSGYIFIKDKKYNYSREHRLVVETILGRKLKNTEEVHHINENPSDNNITNLMAFSSKSAHRRFHYNPKNVKRREIIFDGRNHQKGLKKCYIIA